MAITIGPANERLGMLIPKAIAMTAPSEAPDDTPNVEPSASGLRNKPCMAAPQSESDAPTSATHSTRGRRTEIMIDWEIPAGTGNPNKVLQIAVTVSKTGMVTLPRQTHMIITARVARLNIIYSNALNPSDRKSVV